MATSTYSVKKLPFHPILLALDLDKVTFFHFASIFFCEFGISVFKPLKKRCIPYPFKELFKEIEISERQLLYMTNQFVDFARFYILTKNGYDMDEAGYHRVNGFVPNIAHVLIDLL